MIDAIADAAADMPRPPSPADAMSERRHELLSPPELPIRRHYAAIDAYDAILLAAPALPPMKKAIISAFDIRRQTGH
jgi:hypothetical protein